MSHPDSLPALIRRRAQILEQLAQLGDFRPGTLSSQYRKCGTPGCHCAQVGDPGHGPYWVLNHSVAGKTRSRAVPAAQLETTRKQVKTYQRSRELMREWTELNGRICELRLRQEQPGEPEKRGRWSQRSRPKSSRS